ncbi:MAG: HAD-IIIC family phosphatase [Melioribacteraceae bacterium]
MKIAFLTSYNTDLFKKELEKYISNYIKNCSFFFNAYGTQEKIVYDKSSSLYSFNPNIIIIHFEIEWLLGDFAYDILSLAENERYNKLKEYESKISLLIQNITDKLPNTKIIIENFIPRDKPILSILDSNINYGLEEITLQLNNFLFSQKKIYSDRIIIHDYATFISNFGRINCFDYRLYRLAKNPFAKSFYNELFNHYTNIIDALVNPRKKCIVVDLDNTLWGGIVGQDGVENIILGGTGIGEAYVQFQKVLLNFYRKGIFLGICSKNNYEDAMEVIEKHPDMILRKENFASIKINWLDKVTNIINIANDLNISTDSIVFLDDNPVECELVRQKLPEVEVVNLSGDPDNYIKQLLSIRSLNTTFLTDEDLVRNKMFLANEKRKELEQNSFSLDDYYKSLEMKAHIYVNDISHISRISQLTQKTNQFNLTTRRYTVEEVKNFIQNGEYRIYTLRLLDKFGDNGIVLVAIIKMENEMWVIDTFLMSCRVIGRQAETALLEAIIDDAQRVGVKSIIGEFIKTPKNAPAENFFSNHRFTLLSNNKWKLDLPAKKFSHYIKIIRGN